MFLPLCLISALLLGIPSTWAQAPPQEENTCYAEEQLPYLFFSSKTAYQYIYDKKPQVIPYCKPVQVWMLSRHGTRYPSLKEIKRMKDLNILRTQILKNMETQDPQKRLCEKDINKLKAWNYNLTTDLENQLTFQGHDDLLFVGKRMKSKFSILSEAAALPEKESQKYLLFRSTNTTRTVESARAFLEGIYGDKVPVEFPPSVDIDPLIKPYDKCKTWDGAVKSKEVQKEVTMFQEGPFMKGTLARVSKRLGFSYNLTLDTIDLIYEMCRYEKAWHLQTLPAWCAAFSKQDLKVMEYNEDLKYYYKNGYGNVLSQRLACPLVQDLFTRFKKTANLKNPSMEEVGSVGTFYFSHSSMILLLLNRLDIAHDKYALTHDNFPTQNKRLWRTSLIDPFGANLAAVFYKCSQGEENQVAFYLNEHIVDYPGCNVGLCSWDFLLNKFRHVLDPAACNNDFCNSSSSTSLDASSLLLCGTALLALLYTSIV